MILDQIVTKVKENLSQQKAKIPFNVLENAIKFAYSPRDIKPALKNKNKINIIAEIKKASPSKGLIRQDFDPLKIALDYEKAEVAAFSVLTEKDFFQGDLEYLALVRRYSTTPILRKDFIIDPYQIAQARIYGADFILLIARILDQSELENLLNYARELNLEALIEVHDEQDLDKALKANATIIGINHRNLQDFSMNLDLSKNLIPLIPKDKIIVAESGLYSHDQLLELKNIGVDAFLIGEHFMRQDNVFEAVKKIKGEI
nr:indole-3-glycerol phosphate synthase TrpC [Campylobacter sp.]